MIIRHDDRTSRKSDASLKRSAFGEACSTTRLCQFRRSMLHLGRNSEVLDTNVEELLLVLLSILQSLEYYHLQNALFCKFAVDKVKGCIISKDVYFDLITGITI